jgi:hypothetical protein
MRVLVIRKGMGFVEVIDEADLVVVESDMGTPIAIAHRHVPNGYILKHAQEPGFEAVARELGVLGVGKLKPLIVPGG